MSWFLPVMKGLHILSAVFWVGGMFFAYLVLRPSLLVLEPNQRMLVHTQVFRRFFRVVWHAMPLSIATGLVKAIMVMVGTPIAAKFLGLRTPRSAMVFGGLAGTVSGVSAGLAATDRKLVPYGALVATFHTGLGCLLGPSVLFFATKALMG